MGEFTKSEIAAVIERAVKTFAQAFIAYVAAGNAASLYEVDWETGFGIAALAAVLSVMSSVVSFPFGPGTGPSVAGEVPRDEFVEWKNRAVQAEAEAELDRLSRGQ